MKDNINERDEVDKLTSLLFGNSARTIARWVIQDREATRQAVLTELLEKAPEDPPKTHSGLITAFTLAEAIQKNNAQWKEALEKIRSNT
jgi:hypothetical protein